MAHATVAVFPQLVKELPRAPFDQCVAKYNSDKGAKGVKHYDVLCSLLFCQFSGADSLRDIQFGLQSLKGLGLENHTGAKALKRTTLAYTLAHRDYRVFEDYYFLLKALYEPIISKTSKKKQNSLLQRLGKPVMLMDSTTITLCLNAFKWAHYSHAKGAIKLHTVLNGDAHLPEVIVATSGKVGDVTAARDLTQFPPGSIVVMDRGYNDYRFFAKLTADHVTFITRIKDNAKHSLPATNTRAIDQSENPQWGDYEIEVTYMEGTDSDDLARSPEVLEAVSQSGVKKSVAPVETVAARAWAKMAPEQRQKALEKEVLEQAKDHDLGTPEKLKPEAQEQAAAEDGKPSRKRKAVYRLVQWYDREQGRWFEFITNNFVLSVEEVQMLYHERWNIELFFKKIKQNLKIKSFLGTDFNAVMSQVWAAAIAVLLLEVLKLKAQFKWSFSNLVHNLRLNLMNFISLEEWLNHPLSAMRPPPESPQLPLI